MGAFKIVRQSGLVETIEGDLIIISDMSFFFTKGRGWCRISHLESGALAASESSLSKAVESVKNNLKKRPNAINKIKRQLKKLNIKYPVN